MLYFAIVLIATDFQSQKIPDSNICNHDIMYTEVSKVKITTFLLMIPSCSLPVTLTIQQMSLVTVYPTAPSICRPT